MRKPVRLAYLVSHPIQYQAPLLRRIAQDPQIELTVLYGSDFSARGYQDKGFGVSVAWDVPMLSGYCYRVLPALRDNGTVSAWTPLSRGLLRALCDRTGKPAFDALWVHGYASANALRAIVAARVLGIPVLLRCESWLGDRSRGLAKLAVKKAFFQGLRPLVSAVLPIGSHNAAYWSATLGRDVPQFPVPYAVDNGYFRQKAEAATQELEDLRLHLRIKAGCPVILFASKLQKRKHADHLLQAIAKLTSSKRPYLLVAGDGDQRPSLEELAHGLGLGEQVRFLGFQNQSQLPALFALAHVFVLPSRHEPWGLILNEAMASGCAVIASDEVGAARDLVVDGENGFVYPAGDVEALAQALTKILALPETAHRMGEASLERIRRWDYEADVRGLRAALAFTTRRLAA